MVSSLALNPILDWTLEEDSLSALVFRVAQGDENCLAQLYDRTNRIVYGLALRILSDPVSAEEVTLDVYMQVWRTAATYTPARGSATAWLVTVTRSRAIDRLRSRRNRTQLEQSLEDCSALQDSAPSPEITTIESSRSRIVKEAVAELPPEQRKLIEMAFFNGFTHKEIATRFELPLGTVKTRIRLGMERLRQSLGTFGEGL